MSVYQKYIYLKETISSGQLQIQAGIFSGWEHCHLQKGVLEPREGGGQSLKLWVGGGQES